MYDVVWSDSEEKWVVRGIHLRFVGDDILDRKRFEGGRALKDAEDACALANQAKRNRKVSP